MELASFLVGVVGTLAGILGVGIAVQQSRKVHRIEAVRQRQIRGALMLLTERLDLDEARGEPASAQGDSTTAVVAQAHRDLYRNLVESYIAGEGNFSTADLAAAAASGLIRGEWAIDVWRQLSLQPDEEARQFLLRGNGELDFIHVKNAVSEDIGKTSMPNQEQTL